jgi:23S rRNA (guanosine2251-2'-O)-methyltransferase
MKALRGTELKRFHRGMRKEYPATHSIVAILQSVEYPANVGSIFRIADAAALDELILCGITPTPENPTVAKVGRGKHTRVPWRYVEDTAQAIAEVKAEGYRVYALELTADAVPYHTIQWPENVCLVVGHEDHGVTKATLALCDEAVFLPMWGKGASLNVHVALGILVYQIRAQGIG